MKHEWMGNYMEDKRGITPLRSGHPVPGYVYDADKGEREAWLYYVQAIEAELESGKGNPDYARLREANESWKKAADAQTAAHIKWEKVRYL